MTTSEKGNQIREAVGVFSDAEAMQQAIEGLLRSGFEHSELSLLASEETVNEKLGHKYKRVAEIEDDAAVPRARYVSQEAISEGEYVFTGGTRLVGHSECCRHHRRFRRRISGCAHRGGLRRGDWGLAGEILSKFIGENHARYVEEQLKHGGLLLWVRCLNSERETSATEILSRHSGRDVHVHSLPASV